MTDIYLAKQFSRHPAGRYKTDGPYSGELFREEHLIPAIRDKKKVVVHLDGARGYGSSFLEEAFGGLVRLYSKEIVDSLVMIDSRDSNLLSRIKLYMENAKGNNVRASAKWFGA